MSNHVVIFCIDWFVHLTYLQPSLLSVGQEGGLGQSFIPIDTEDDNMIRLNLHFNYFGRFFAHSNSRSDFFVIRFYTQPRLDIFLTYCRWDCPEAFSRLGSIWIKFHYSEFHQSFCATSFAIFYHSVFKNMLILETNRQIRQQTTKVD